MADLIVIWGFWNRIRSQDDPILGGALSYVWPLVGIALSIAAIVFSVLVATFPGEWGDETVLTKPLHQLFVAGAADEVTGRTQSFFSNRLVLKDQAFVDSEKLEKAEVSHSFRGRDLRGAVLDRADLRQADFTGARLDKTGLVGAKLGKARFGCGIGLERPGFYVALPAGVGCTSLKGASLDSAHLEGALLENAQLQGASLSEASLQGASLDFAHLEGANLYFARLQGASLLNAHLEGANLDHAGLQGAFLENAQLRGASLDKANVWRVWGEPEFSLSSRRELLNCTAAPWGLETSFPEWRDRILSTLPKGDQKYQLRDRLSVLDPDKESNALWWAQCPQEKGPDPKELADYLVTLACSAEAAPHVARGLIRYRGSIRATGVEIATIADRLRRGKADAKTCSGINGFTDGDWEQLD